MPLGLNSISGLMSGLDTASLVDSLIQFERRPAFLLEARKAQEELRLASYDALEGGLASLKNQLDILRRPTDFHLRTAKVSHDEINPCDSSIHSRSSRARSAVSAALREGLGGWAGHSAQATA